MVKRKKPALKVKLKIDSSLKSRFNIFIESIEPKALDISVSGIGLLSGLFLPEGTIVDLELKVKDRFIKTRGEIKSAVSISNSLARLGIRFIDLSKTNSKVIERFIKDNERRRLAARLKLSKKGLTYGKRNKN